MSFENLLFKGGSGRINNCIAEMDVTTQKVEIQGMTCGKCERLIREGVLENVTGVKEVKVFREDGYALLQMERDAPSVRAEVLNIIQNLVNGKFKAKFVTTTSEAARQINASEMALLTRKVEIQGMTCGKCERLIREGLLENISDVTEVQVFREDGYALLQMKRDAPTVRTDILKIIHSLINGKFKANFTTQGRLNN